jgi:hypothetical protein
MFDLAPYLDLKKTKKVWWGQEIHREEDRKKNKTKCVTNVSL